MNFPLTFWDISLLAAFLSIILLISSEMLSSHYGRVPTLINKKKLQTAALTITIIFLITAALRVISTIIYQ